MDDVNEHLDEYNNIPKDEKELIVELHENGYSIDQIMEETQHTEHDISAVLSEANCVDGGVYKRNHPDSLEAEVGDEIRSRKKISKEKTKADRKNVNKGNDPIYYDTGANYFAYSSSEGMKTHAEFNSFWEIIFKYWVLYLRREIPYDVIDYDIDNLNITSGEELKDLFASLEKDLKLNSYDAGSIAGCKNKIWVRDNNAESPIIGIERFSVIYNYEREGKIDKWDVMRCLVINEDLYNKLKAIYYEDLAKNKKHGYTPYKRAWLEDFDGFDKIFMDFIQNKSSIHDMALKLSTKKKIIREEMIRLKVIFYARSLNFSDADKERLYNAYMHWHTITIRNGYRASHEGSAATYETENETENKATNEMEENRMVKETVTVEKEALHPSGVHLTDEEKDKTREMFNLWVAGFRSISSIAHELNTTDNAVNNRFNNIRKTLPEEEQDNIRKLMEERRQNSKNLDMATFETYYKDVIKGDMSEWDVMDALMITKATYDRMVKSYEDLHRDDEKESESEPELKTVEDDGKPYWIDENGVKRMKGHGMEYSAEVALKFADELAQRNELIKKNNTSSPKIDEEEVVEASPVDKVIISRKPIVVAMYTPGESAFVDSRAYIKMVDAHKAFVKQAIHFEDDKPQEEMLLFANKNLDAFSLLALTTACKELNVTLTLSRTDEETGEEISRSIISNPEGYDLSICDMFKNDSKVELLGINSMDDVTEAKSILLGVYSEAKMLKYRLRVISTDEDLLKERYKELISDVMDSNEHIAVGIYDSHLKDGVVVDDLKSNMLFTNFS